MATTSRNSKTYTISLPPELAAKAEALAKRESRTMSELFREAFRHYHAQSVDKLFADLAADPNRNPMGYTEEDVPRLIKEFRAQEAAEEAARQPAKAS